LLLLVTSLRYVKRIEKNRNFGNSMSRESERVNE